MDNTQLIIDRIIRMSIQDKATGELKVLLTQVSNPAIKATMETTEVKDALEATISEIGRAKGLEITGENALFDMGLLAAQFGGKAEESSEADTFTVPSFMEELTLDANKKAVLSHKPAGEGAGGIAYIYSLNNDGTKKAKYEYAAAASDTAFTWAADEQGTAAITAPAELENGARILVIYDYLASASDKTLRAVNKADSFPESGVFSMEVLFRSVCDRETKYHGFVYSGNAQLDGNFDLNLTPDGKHPFTVRAMKDYCAKDQELCTFFIPDAD